MKTHLLLPGAMFCIPMPAAGKACFMFNVWYRFFKEGGLSGVGV